MELSDLTNKTKKELNAKIEELESFITKKGIGSGYISKIERIQRRINIFFLLSAVTAVVGLLTWLTLKDGEETD